MLLLLAALATADAQPRVLESVLPAMLSGKGCTSSVELRSLSNRPVRLQVEAHHASGALAPLSGMAGLEIDLAPLAQATLRPESETETGSGWVKIREPLFPSGSASVAIQGVTECLSGEKLSRVVRDVAFPTRSPWFSGDVAELPGSEILLINTSPAAVVASGCYSSGSLFSTPSGGSELEPVCSASFHEQVPPFGTRQFPVRRENSTHFSIGAQGPGIVLEMLRPVDASLRLFQVDSTIHFGSEVTPVK